MKFFQTSFLNYVFVILLTFAGTWYFISDDKNKLVSASEKSISSVVTISSVNNVSFGKSIPIGTTVTIEAKVSRAFTTSMEVFIDVWIDDDEGKKIRYSDVFNVIYWIVATRLKKLFI